jgi:D-inositol-3-phosphate glycosyltransferase
LRGVFFVVLPSFMSSRIESFLSAGPTLPTVAIVLPSLSARGGIPALALFLYHTLKASTRYDPRLISLATSARDLNSTRLLQPASWFRGVRASSERLGDIPYIHVGAHATEVEPFRYRPRQVLTELLNRHDIVQVVAGSPALAHIARDVRRPVALYVATMVDVERRALLQENGLGYRWRRLMTQLVTRMDRTGWFHADTVFVINAWMYHLGQSLLGTDRVFLSPPGIDTELFHPEGAPTEEIVLTVGRLDDPRKNISLLLESFARLRASRQSARLILAGERAPENRVMERARALGLLDVIDVRLQLTPAELAQLYRRATVFALSSDEEGLGIAALEAMASGVPVVATRCGGPELTVIHGQTGFLVPVGDADAFASKLELLLQDPNLRGRMGEASRQRAVEEFSLGVTRDVFLGAYDALLSLERAGTLPRHAAGST